MKNKLSHVCTPTTAAALCLLLAACGGGSGGTSEEKAVSSSPDAQSAIKTEAGSTGNTASANDPAVGTASTSEGGDTGTSGTPGNDAASGSKPGAMAATSDQTITDQGIRGDVLRSMLDQKLNDARPHDTPSASAADGRYGWFKAGTGAPGITNNVKLEPDNYADHSKPNIPWPVLRYQPLNGSSEYQLNSYVQSRGGINSDTTLPFRQLSMKVGISADREQLSLGKTMTLKVGPTAANWKTDVDSTEDTVILAANGDKAIKTDTLIPFGQVLQTWRGDNNQKVELVLADRCNLARVDSDGQIIQNLPERSPGAELCWNLDLNNVKRQICTMYKVPSATIAADAEPAGLSQAILQEMADDRSTYAGETGSAYWRDGDQRCEGKGGLQ